MTGPAATEPPPAPAARRERLLGHLALGGSVVGIGSAFIFVRVSDVDATSTLMLRMTAATLMLGALMTPRERRPRPREISGRDLALLILAGVVSGFDLLANQWSVSYTSVANAAFLMNTTPVFVLALAWLLHRERVAAATLAALALALCGGALVVLGGAGDAPSGVHFYGDGLAVASAALYAVALLMTRRLRERLPTLLIMIVNSLTIAVILAPIALTTSRPLVPAHPAGYLVIVAYALVSQLLGHGLMTYALRTVNPALASMSGLLRPVVAAFLAWLILGEDMDPLQLCGGAVLLVALFFFQRTRTPAAPAVPDAAVPDAAVPDAAVPETADPAPEPQPTEPAL
jgi:drug/metabolite transporter (DMT)-like permease